MELTEGDLALVLVWFSSDEFISIPVAPDNELRFNGVGALDIDLGVDEWLAIFGS